MTEGFATGVACDGCPPIPDLMKRYGAAGGELLVCPICCFNARQLDDGTLMTNAKLGGAVPFGVDRRRRTTFSC